MPALHLSNVPPDVYERLEELAATHRRTPEAEAVDLLRQGVFRLPAARSQAELLNELRQRRFVPPADAPDSVELLREDRGR